MKHLNQQISDIEFKIKSAILTFIITVLLLLTLYFSRLHRLIIHSNEIVIDFRTNTEEGEFVEEHSDFNKNNLSYFEKSNFQLKSGFSSNIHENPEEISKNINLKNNEHSQILKKYKDQESSNTKSYSINKESQAEKIINLFEKGRNNISTATQQSIESERKRNSTSEIKQEFIQSEEQEKRKLISWIPGTLHRSKELHPNHSCENQTGIIVIRYTVNQSGKVIDAYKQSGNVSDCIKETSISWVKKYVKAEIGTKITTASYRIEFY